MTPCGFQVTRLLSRFQVGNDKGVVCVRVAFDEGQVLTRTLFWLEAMKLISVSLAQSGNHSQLVSLMDLLSL